MQWFNSQTLFKSHEFHSNLNLHFELKRETETETGEEEEEEEVVVVVGGKGFTSTRDYYRQI